MFNEIRFGGDVFFFSIDEIVNTGQVCKEEEFWIFIDYHVWHKILHLRINKEHL